MKIMSVAGKTYGFIVASFLALPIVAAILMWIADGAARGRFDAAKIISVRYITAVTVFMLFLIPFWVVASRRKVGDELTWGQAMVAAVYVFFLLFWLYGVIPHEFLNWADAELNWRPDKVIIGPKSNWTWWHDFWTSIPIDINKQIFRDILVVLLYAVGLGGFIWAFHFWAHRGDAPKDVAVTSAYGRPLVSKAKG